MRFSSATECDLHVPGYNNFDKFSTDVPEGILPARCCPHVPWQVQARPARLRAGVQGAAQRQGLEDQVHRMQEDRAGSRSCPPNPNYHFVT